MEYFLKMGDLNLYNPDFKWSPSYWKYRNYFYKMFIDLMSKVVPATHELVM